MSATRSVILVVSSSDVCFDDSKLTDLSLSLSLSLSVCVCVCACAGGRACVSVSVSGMIRPN